MIRIGDDVRIAIKTQEGASVSARSTIFRRSITRLSGVKYPEMKSRGPSNSRAMTSLRHRLESRIPPLP